MKTSFNHVSYLQDARNMYRNETEKRHKDALVECFFEDFSNLNQKDQEAMKADLTKELQACKKKLVSAQGKKREQLEKDIELFSILAKELGIEFSDAESMKQDLETINKALQKATDDPLRNIKKSDFISPLIQEKYEELDQVMRNQFRGIYSRSKLFQQLGDFVERILMSKHWKTELKEKNIYEQYEASEFQLDEKNSILLESFDDADFGVAFAKYCQDHGIKRADGKQIPLKGGMATDVDYLDAERNVLRLKAIRWGADPHEDTGAFTEYKLIQIPSSQKNKLEPKAEEGLEPKSQPEPQPALQPEPQSELNDTYDFNLNAAISDTFSVHQEQAKLAAEEALKNDYAQIGKWNLWKKGKFFLQRGKMRKKLIKDFMEKTSDSAFWNTVEQAADRHSRELDLGLAVVKEQEIITLPEVNELARDFIEGSIDESAFQASFDDLCENNPTLQAVLEKMSHKGTNILEKLKLERAQYQLVNDLAEVLEKGENTDHIQARIEQFLRDYQQSPDFLSAIQENLDKKDLERLKRYFRHQKAIRNQALKNLEIKLSILTWGKSAYQIDNTDREKGWINKLGHKLDKLPAWAQVWGMVGISGLAALAGGPLGLGVVWTSILTTSTVAGTTGFMNFVKKWTHHTKEQNTHEKNLTHTFGKEQMRSAQWKKDLTLKGAKNRYKKYHAKRQLELYDQTTQQNIVSTQEVNQTLLAFSTSLRSLTPQAKSATYAYLMQAKARLEAYQKTGHNFLASENPELVEQDMNLLHKAIVLACEKLGISYDAIDELVLESSDGDERLTYDEIYQNLFDDYAASTKQFRSQRRWLAGKYGIGTTALSAGAALGTQWLFDTGVFATEASTQYTDSLSQLVKSDQFNLGSHELANGSQIQDAASEAFKNLSDQGSVVANYGAGTDATALKAWSILASPEAYHAKLDAVREQIQNLNLTFDQKKAFLDELSSKPWEADWSKAFTNDYLQGDRCAEGLFHLAKGLEASGNQTLIPDLNYDTLKSIAGTTVHSSKERVFGIGLELTDKVGQEVAGSGSTWWIPITGFANTFKDMKVEESDATVQEPENDRDNVEAWQEVDAVESSSSEASGARPNQNSSAIWSEIPDENSSDSFHAVAA